MKCQNCGKNEVNFHYTSNVNGTVTQTYLCAECAEKSGFDFEGMFDAGSIFGEFSPAFGRLSAGFPFLTGEFFPFTTPMLRLGGVFPALAQAYEPAQDASCECGCGKIAPETQSAEVDDEMRKRREVNMIREQMRIAAENDDFEKAIELREKIREMEA